MTITFESITLDSGTDDREAVLMLCDGSLTAVLTQLSDMHGALAGRWFVEIAFRQLPLSADETFDRLSAVEARMADAPH